MKVRLFRLLVLIVLSGCSKQPPVDHGRDCEQVLHLNLSDDPVAFDPRKVRNLKDLTVVKQLFEGLMRLDAHGVPQPALAQSVDISDDLLTYTFHLREAKWSQGELLSANDFYRAWMEVLTPSFASDYAHMLYPIKNAQQFHQGLCTQEELGIAVVDDTTLIVTLQIPTPYFLELTAFPTLFPVYSRQGDSDVLISNGPFRLEKWTAQAEVSLVKNPFYWDSAHVVLDRITFSIISDSHTESQLFETGALDWLGQPISNNIASELVDKMKQEGRLSSYEIAGTLWFKFNTQQEPFDNLFMRKAFTYALNREEIIVHILQGHQMPASSPLPPCMAVKDQHYFLDGDVLTAKALFEQGLIEKGWSHETFPPVILNYSPSERNNKIVQQVQQQWQKALGVKVELQALEAQIYARNTKRGLYQVGIGQWIADFNDPLAILEIFKSSLDAKTGAGLNDTGWYDATYAHLLEASLTERDPAQRRLLLQQAEVILMEAMPIAPLYHYAFDYVKKSYVQDVILSPLGIADFKMARITDNYKR
jgi:oligopeptide transport system substrate-binding protein